MLRHTYIACLASVCFFYLNLCTYLIVYSYLFSAVFHILPSKRVLFFTFGFSERKYFFALGLLSINLFWI